MTEKTAENTRQDKSRHLYEKLRQLKNSSVYPCHMPGHKRNMTNYPMREYYGLDITEIDGFDNLHNPQGILKETMTRAGSLYGAETYLLVNGSTGGILSAVSAAVRRGDMLLMARNSHRAAYHAIYLNDCKVKYIFPSFLEAYGICGDVSAQQVDKMLTENPQVRAVLLTSPTYDGVVSDVKAIAACAHRRGIPVIVDAAHGAHFLLDGFPASAVDCGADLVIHSIHKTLPALTQTALVHVQGNLIDRERLRWLLTVYQTSSPSYLLLAGIEQCISILEEEGSALSRQFFENNKLFEQNIQNLKYLRVFGVNMRKTPAAERAWNMSCNRELFDFDVGKKVISARGSGMSGQALYHKLLEKYGIQMEMAGQDYVTAIMTVMDRREGFLRLADALADIDSRMGAVSPVSCTDRAKRMNVPQTVFEIGAALEMERETKRLEDCEGEVAAQFIQIYPPGIPLIVPGERFTGEIIDLLLEYRQQGFQIEGMREQAKKADVVRKEIYAQDENYLYDRAGM